MSRTISLSASALRYVLPHVSSEASRPILNAVCIEPTGLAVATNGHSLVAHRSAAEPVAGICLNPSIAERFAVARDGVAHVRLTFDGETGAMLVRFGQEPDAIGLWMPCRDITPHNAPADPFGSARQAWHFIATRSAPATVGA